MRKTLLAASSVLLTLFVATYASAQQKGPPISEPVDTNVLNFPNVQTVDGSVSISNFPQSTVTQFARRCTANEDACSVDLTDLAQMGEVRITHVSGAALNVGEFASPRFRNGSSLVVLPPTINSTGTGLDRDIVFGQSMDLIPADPVIQFEEPESSTVFFYLSGYVISSSGDNAAPAIALGTAASEIRELP